MRNKLKLFITVALIAALSLFAFAACKETEDEQKITYEQDGVVYTYEKEQGGFFATGLSGSANVENLIFLKSISTGDVSADVIGIAADAFAMTGVQHVSIHSGIKSVGDYAFKHCASLEDVSFENNSQLKEIGDYAFAYCKKLTRFDFGRGSGVEKLGSSAFRGNAALEEITLPAGVSEVGEYCFSDDYSLSLYLGKKHTEIQSLIEEGKWSGVWNKDGTRYLYYA